MRKLIRALCSIFFVTAICLPAEAATNPSEEADDANGETVLEPFEANDYQLGFLTGNFNVQFADAGATRQAEDLMLFINGMDGKIVKDAQVVTTTIDQQGKQTMRRAYPFKGGYLIDTKQLHPGPYRLEAEVITNGWLLTNEFHFRKA